MADGRMRDRNEGLWARIKRFALTDVGALMRGLNAEDLEKMERVLIEADFGVPATVELTAGARGRGSQGEAQDGGGSSPRPRGVGSPPCSTARRIPATIARSSGGPNGHPAGRRERDRQDDHGGQARAPASARGPKGAARGSRHLPRRRHQLSSRCGPSGWACPVSSGAPGGDPAAVAFDAIDAAVSRGLDTVIVDTAGRLHTQEGLMEELRKVVRVIGRRLPGAPHETLLVLDGTVGQNAVQQGRLFTEAVAPTGIVVTKLDGSARGGAVTALRRELGCPIRFIGLGRIAGRPRAVRSAERFAEHLLADSI